MSAKFGSHRQMRRICQQYPLNIEAAYCYAGFMGKGGDTVRGDAALRRVAERLSPKGSGFEDDD